MRSGRDVEINLPQANHHFIFSVVCVREGGREKEGERESIIIFCGGIAMSCYHKYGMKKHFLIYPSFDWN